MPAFVCVCVCVCSLKVPDTRCLEWRGSGAGAMKRRGQREGTRTETTHSTLTCTHLAHSPAVSPTHSPTLLLQAICSNILWNKEGKKHSHHQPVRQQQLVERDRKREKGGGGPCVCVCWGCMGGALAGIKCFLFFFSEPLSLCTQLARKKNHFFCIIVILERRRPEVTQTAEQISGGKMLLQWV